MVAPLQAAQLVFYTCHWPGDGRTYNDSRYPIHLHYLQQYDVLLSDTINDETQSDTAQHVLSLASVVVKCACFNSV